MAIEGTWLAVDIIGTALDGEPFIHSAGGDKVAKPLKRCASKLGLDRVGEMTVRAVIAAGLEGRDIPAIDGLHIETHQIDASDGTPTALLVWIGQQAPSPRPTYNAWILDMGAMTTRTSGDNPAMIGDGRQPDEERHVQHLFTWLNPEDAWTLVGGYYDAKTGEDGLLIQSYWSLRPPGTEWVHMWSSCRLRVREGGAKRVLYGITLKLEERDLPTNLASMARFTNGTLLLVEAKDRFPLTSVGGLAPLSESQFDQVLAQIDLNDLSDPSDPEKSGQKLEIDGQPFMAYSFELHSGQAKHGDPVAVILLTRDDAASAQS